MFKQTKMYVNTLFKLRQRSCLLLALVVILLSCVIVVMIMGPELSNEQSLSQRLVECQMRLQYLESVHSEHQEDVALPSHHLIQLQNNSTGVTDIPAGGGGSGAVLDNNSSMLANSASAQSSSVDALTPEALQILRNASHLPSQQIHLAASSNGLLPTPYFFLPHLLNDPNSLRPALLRSRGRSNVSIILGIPTVLREEQSYLVGTLHNLIENMNEEEQNETLIIVYIGEFEAESVQHIAKTLEAAFEPYIECGLIEIIAPSPSYYPNFEELRITLNDSLERVKWRSKQNLDFIYLMAYAQTKGTFYVQLEDDILTRRHFITKMKKFAVRKSASTKPDQAPWFILDFCQLGFIGKMFRSVDLPYLITYFQIFYSDKPGDWLLDNFMECKVCRNDMKQKVCNREMAKYRLHYRRSLFQHIGINSSLKGKIQNLKDKHFGSKARTFYAHTQNPPAQAITNITQYKDFQVERAYRGETYFRGLLPQRGDLVQFIFDKPTVLKHYLFRSGNSKHPSERFYNTTIEVLPADTLSESSPVWSTYNSTTDGYLIVGSFDDMGVAEGSIDSKIGAINEIRHHVQGNLENWVLLSEINLQAEGNKS